MPGIAPIAPYEPPVAEARRANGAGWTADPRRAVLLIHDMQEYFLRPFPPGPPMDTVLPNAVRLRKECADAGVPVVYSAQPGDMSEEQRGLLKAFWGSGMSAGEADRAIHPDLAPSAQDTVLTKWRYSAFFRTPLLDLMRSWGRDQLIVCGVYAHIGCLMTAMDAFTHDIEPFLVADAVADFRPEDHAAALSYAARSCARVVETEDILRQIAAGPGRRP